MIVMEIVLATKNAGKIRELGALLTAAPIKVLGLGRFETIAEPDETGATFSENAVLKAKYYALQTGRAALADDSGLEVEALGGAPGVFSARYGGENASYPEKISLLLEEIRQSGSTNRGARFVCAMAIADATGGIEFIAEGVCRGRLRDAPRGAGGFGYDPIFIPEGFSETFGELPDSIKQKISHRARAIEKIIRFLRAFTAV